MLIHRLIYRIHRKPDDGDGSDLGGYPAQLDTGAPLDAPAVEAPAEPATMAEAMWNRDDQGRFAPKVADVADPAAAVAQAAPKPGEPAKPAAPAAPAAEDLTAMPEGLGAKAQQRFQALANGLKERDTTIQELTSSVEYVQQAFQQHGVQQPQFEQAVAVIGMLNKGDFRGALQVLDDQRRQIALQLGEALPGVDALQDHQDLRQAVDGLQITEAHALELARSRAHQQATQQREQATNQQRQQEQTAQQAVHKAQADVDTWWKQMAASDIDAPAIEAILLPKLGALLDGVPPQQWAGRMRAQYELIKESVGTFRRQAPAASQAMSPLRATGQAGGVGKPASMHEAMWGGSRG